MIQINTRLTFKDYLNYNYRHFFNSFIIRFFAFLTTIILGFFVYEIILKNSDYQYRDNVSVNFNALIFPGIFTLTIISVYFLSKRNFNNTKSLQEPITYSFSNEIVKVKGESFESENNWEKYIKVLETKSLFVFYQDKLIANLVPKADFNSSSEINALRELISSKSNLKSKLRKD